jgi:hypothetical protein
MGLLGFLGGVRRLRLRRDRGEGDAAAAPPPVSSDPSVPPPDGASPLMASSAEILPAIVARLGGHALASLASTCRELRRATSGDGDVGAATYWRALCEGALGRTLAWTHARAGGLDATSSRTDAAFWRRLFAASARPDRAAHWHAETALEAWTSVYDQDEARRMRAFDAAEAANGHDPGPPAWGPDTRRNHPATATHPHRPAPESEDARAEAARLALSARAPSACPLLTRSGHTATLIDELGLIVVVGGLSAASDGAHSGLRSGHPGDVATVLVIKMPRGEASVEKPVEVLVPEILNPDPPGARRAPKTPNTTPRASSTAAGDPMTSNPGGHPMPDAPRARFRHCAFDARLPPGSRLSRDAFGDDGVGWGACCEDDDGEDIGERSVRIGSKGSTSGSNTRCARGATVLVYGGYDGAREVFGGREILLLRVSADGTRARWGACAAEPEPEDRAAVGGSNPNHEPREGSPHPNEPPKVYHHAMVRLRRSPIAVLIGGQTESHANDLRVYLPRYFRLDLRRGTFRAVNGALQRRRAVWLHVAILRGEGARLDEDEAERVPFGAAPKGDYLYGGGPGPRDPRATKTRNTVEEVLVFAGLSTLGMGLGDQPQNTRPLVLRVDGAEETADGQPQSDAPVDERADEGLDRRHASRGGWRLAHAHPDESDEGVWGEDWGNFRRQEVPRDGAREALVLPPERHRAAFSVVGDGGRFVVMNGGCSVRGEEGWLSDTWVLDTHALRWARADVVNGEAMKTRRIAGHTLEGMVAFAGCRSLRAGIVPIARVQFLALGPPPPARVRVEQARRAMREARRCRDALAMYARCEPLADDSDWADGTHPRARARTHPFGLTLIARHATRGWCAAPVESMAFETSGVADVLEPLFERYAGGYADPGAGVYRGVSGAARHLVFDNPALDGGSWDSEEEEEEGFWNVAGFFGVDEEEEEEEDEDDFSEEFFDDDEYSGEEEEDDDSGEEEEDSGDEEEDSGEEEDDSD